MPSQDQVQGELVDHYDKLCSLGVMRSPHEYVAYCGLDFEQNHLEDLEKLFQYNLGLKQQPKAVGVESPRRSITNSQSHMGRFEIVGEIGEGGFGKVYAAIDGLGRQVALKAMNNKRPVTPIFIERFEQEIKILSNLNHVNIARIYESEQLEDGRPCFTMELVEDRREITEFCDQRELSIKERLELFLTLCDAIRYAHQMKVVHRDLKPRNILIGMQGDQPILKVIDFGLAATNFADASPSNSASPATGLHGSSSYGSPEQLLGHSSESSTKFLSDIYSLGAVLCELLCGTPPMSTVEFHQWSKGGADPTYFEHNIPLPSQRLSMVSDAERVAKHRVCTVRQLRVALVDDLDWIVKKATSYKATNRYSTVEALAEDIRRVLYNNPILARPSSISYRLAKSYRRNRLLYRASGIIVSTMVIATIVSLTLAAQALKSQELAERESKTRTAVSRFFTDELLGLRTNVAGIDLRPAPNTERSYVSVLMQASERASILKDEPEVALELHRLLASGFLNLNSSRPVKDMAEINIQRYRDLAIQLYGHDSEQELEAEEMRLVLAEAGLAKADRADIEELIDSRRKLIDRTKAARGQSSDESIGAIQNLGSLLVECKQFDAAEQFLNQAAQLAEQRSLLLHDPLRLSIENSRALLDFNRGEYRASIERLENALQVGKTRLGYQEELTRTLANNLAVSLEEDKQVDLAINLLEELVTVKKQYLGTIHISTQKSIENLGRIHLNAGRLVDASKWLREAIRIMKTMEGADHEQVQSSQFALGMALLRSREGIEARAVLTELFETRSRLYGPTDLKTKSAQRMLTESLLMIDNPQEALPLCEELWSSMINVPPEKRGWAYHHAMSQIAAARLAAVGVTQESLELAERAWLFFEKSPSQDFPEVQGYLAERVVSSLANRQQFELVEEWKARAN